MEGKLETRVGLFVLAAIGIFIYMGFQLGSFRFDTNKYNPFIVYFKDISGLSRKAEVKIAGVKVGWVDEVQLIPDGQMVAKIKIMVLKDYVLHDDAYAIVRQDGLLGPKYLELSPGDPLLRKLEPGSSLGKSNLAAASIDEVMQKVKSITTNIESVTESLKSSLGGPQGSRNLEAIMNNIQNATQKLSSFSDVLDRTISRNEENLTAIMQVGQNLNGLIASLQSDLFPSVKESITKISTAVDRDFNRVADSFASTARLLEDASLQARDGFANITSVAQKIDEGKGLLGKLINEDETYRDLKVAIGGLKNYFAQINQLEIVIDGHTETMHRPADHYRWEDSKFYLDMRIYPSEDKFYIVGLASSERGWRTETETIKEYFNRETGAVIETSTLNFFDDTPRVEDIYNQRTTTLTRYATHMQLQFGKIFSDIALRIGLFDGFGGVGMDFNIPVKSNKFRWITSIEAFDMTGWNKIQDRRPHFKWINRMYILRNIYAVFGADDFASKNNASGFVGFGLRFTDDDIKYLLPSIGAGAKGFSGG